MAFAMCTWIVLGSVLHPIKDELPSFNNTDFCISRVGNSSLDADFYVTVYVTEFRNEYTRQLDMLRNNSAFKNVEEKGELL